jgi:hypothetical protein
MAIFLTPVYTILPINFWQFQTGFNPVLQEAFATANNFFKTMIYRTSEALLLAEG